MLARLMAPKRILIVEDTKNIREIVAKILRTKGYIVYEAEHGGEGLKIAQLESPDLILLDAMLPDMDGFEICASLKGNPKYKTIPILMLTAITGGSSKQDEHWRQKSGADEFMSKPFRMNDLLAKIEKFVGAHEPEAQPPSGNL